MSQIFDALQRSEAERSGNGSAAARATELLQRTESYVASKWGTEETTEGKSVADGDGLGVPPLLENEMLRPMGTETADAAPALPVKDRADESKQFEFLRISVPPEGRLVSLPNTESPAGEAFHLLGVRLRHLRRLRPLKKVLVTSTIPQEGKSMVAANLASTLALRTQQKVLLLEGDVRRPSQSKIFGIETKPGICEWLQGARSLAKCIYYLEGAGIWILPAGYASGNSLELLQSGRLTGMMEQLTGWFDWIVIDSPPVLPLADTSVWTNLADGILLVTRQGITQKKQLKRGLEALGTQKLLGALLNSATSVAHTDYYYRPTSRLPNDEADS